MIYGIVFAAAWLYLLALIFWALRQHWAHWEPYKHGYVRCSRCWYIGPEPTARCPGCNARMKK